MKGAALLALLVMSGCGSEDPCASVTGTCLTLYVRGDLAAVDTVGVTLSGAVTYNNQAPLMQGALPVLIGIALPDVTGPVGVEGVAFGGGVELANTQTAVEITAGHHSLRTVNLTPPK